MKTLFIGLTLFCSITAFSQTKERKEMRKNGWWYEYDEMTEKKRKQLNLSSGDFRSMTESSIGIIKSDEYYSLYSYIYRSDWIFVEKMIVKIDGVLYEFSSIDDSRHVMPQAYIAEKNWYRCTDKFIEALKNAKEIKYRLYGKDFYVDFNINPKKLAPIGDFFFE